MEASLYVHVPFCADGKCDYCDFYSVPVNSDDERLPAYVETLLAGAERLFETYAPENIPSVYIGGGTPSVLGPDGIRRLLGGLFQITGRYSPQPAEITVEANPESADEAFLAAAREAGASRLSLGIQTFYGPSRKAVHRRGAETAAGVSLLHERLKYAAQYFPGSFSADMLSGLPFQNENILSDDLNSLFSHKPAHVSLYALTLEDGTALAKHHADGSLSLPEADEADALFIHGRNLLENAGYGQYEVSNFCLPGKESIHNIRYWRMENWLALGPSGSGTIIDDDTGTGLRYTIPKGIGDQGVGTGVFVRKHNLAPYVSITNKASHSPLLVEELDQITLIKETILMGFRYIKGPDQALFRRRFNRDLEKLIPNTLGEWRRRGLLQEENAALAKDGLLLLNRFLLDAFNEIDTQV